MLTMPFEKGQNANSSWNTARPEPGGFVPALWKRLSEEDKDELLGICERQIDRYYETRINR